MPITIDYYLRRNIFSYTFMIHIFQDVEKTLVYPTVPDLRRKVPEMSYHYLLERRRNIMQLKARADELAVSANDKQEKLK